LTRVKRTNTVFRVVKMTGELIVKSHARLCRAKQRGFSMLESVGAVVIAGSVSAVALPKFVEMPTHARVAVVKSMEGAIHSASALIHMKCAVEAGCDLFAGEGAVMASGYEVELRRGYPRAGDPQGIENALQYTGFTASHSAGQTVFMKDGARDEQACAVIYREPPGDGLEPVIQTVTSGC
jgi:hypothetical protein